MAHFAKLDENNKVIEVIVVDNNVLDSNNEEESGIAFLTEWANGYSNWKQTSYNASFRKFFAGIDFEYRADLDAFIPPKPYNSWILNQNTCNWEAPIAYPQDNISYLWDEETLEWTKAPVSE